MTNHHNGVQFAILAEHVTELRIGGFRTKRRLDLDGSFKPKFVSHERRRLSCTLQRARNDRVNLCIARRKCAADFTALRDSFFV